MPDHISESEVAALEAVLKGLAPAKAALDREQMFFRAGQASIHPRRRMARSAIGLLAAAVCVLGTLLAMKPVPETVERIVYVPVAVKESPAPTPAPSPPAAVEAPEAAASMSVGPTSLPGDYLRLRNQVLRWGVESLPQPTPQPASDQPNRATSVLDIFAAE